MRAMGSIQHLKHIHGDGFTLQIGLGEHTQAAVQAAEARITQSLQGMQITTGQVAPDQLCGLFEALGKPSMATEFNSKGTAWALYASMLKNGRVPALNLAMWWVDEHNIEALSAYILQTGFPGSSLVERHSSKLRFKLPNTGQPLGQLFRKVEERKDELNISEYSLSQTTVEEIFNQFAAQQEEEKGIARGMEAAGTSRAAAPDGATNPPGVHESTSAV
jgi:hypothetical protein